MVCPNCFSKKMFKYDIYKYKNQQTQRWKCAKCGFITVHPLHRIPTIHNKISWQYSKEITDDKN